MKASPVNKQSLSIVSMEDDVLVKHSKGKSL